MVLAALALAPTWPVLAAETPDTQLLDDFRDARRWSASASDQVAARVEADGRGGSCLHYDFQGVSGYAVARRQVALTVPAHHAFTLRLHGQGAPNQFQVKWVDASGDNVWWRQITDFVPPTRPTDLRIRQRQIEFAWGPTDDKVLRQAAAIELVVASGRGGGRGKLCFERLEMHRLPAPGPVTEPRVMRDAHGSTLDLGLPREVNGLIWRWAQGRMPRDATIQASDDGQRWRTLHRIRGSQRAWQATWLPEQEARFWRITSPHAVAELRHAGPTEWPDRNAMLKALAATAPRSWHPRAFHGEQNYWTLVGVDGGGASAALISEDGAIEPRRGGPSIEPFVIDGDGAVHGWAEVQARTTLREGHLPVPSVHWSHPRFELQVEAAAIGQRDADQLIARYVLRNPTPQAQSLSLVLALRPWQVNPPQQFLNTPGGVAPIQRIEWRGRTLAVNGRPWLQTLTTPEAAIAGAFDRIDPLAVAARGAAAPRAADPAALASAAVRWPVVLAPGQTREVIVALPLAGQPRPPQDAAAARRLVDAAAAAWRERLNRVALNLPAAAPPVGDTLRAALSHILMSRDGPALQPGTRSYARSWIRDGAMMVAGLLRLGEVEPAREFVQWYARHLFGNGKVPCCVDARGADPVAENDSHGQFIFAVAELWRHTRDEALLQALWPQVDAAARYQEQLRQSERTAANRQPGREGWFGTMPASISHEGYSAKPMHSHWDNFWALTGWRDAVLLARAMGLRERADELSRQHDEFRRELGESLAATMARHRIDHLPGAVELGDFDPTSSTVIFSPAGVEALVPRATLEATWQRWWDESEARRRGTRPWKDYTPYELRSVSSLVRLGWPERALAMLDFFHADRRPAGWPQWAEVVWRDPRDPRFIGDMPHAWISSDYIRSALDLLAYERDSDAALVLAAGVSPAWLRNGPVEVRGLHTAHGRLGYRLTMAEGRVALAVEPGLNRPPGGLWWAWQGQWLPVPADGRLSVPAPGP